MKAVPLGRDDLSNAKAEDEVEFFSGGPPLGRLRDSDLLKLARQAVRHAVIAALVAWLPLLVMTALQSLILGDGSLMSFLTDYAILARSMIAVPLLILAEAFTAPRLSAFLRYFRDAGMVRDQDVARVREFTHSTCRLRDSRVIEAIIAIVAVMLSAAIAWSVPLERFPAWHHLGADVTQASPAGLWGRFVSGPILILLVLGWLWRLVLWTRFLWLVSRLELRLVPSHPDGAGGLKFLGMSLHALAIPVFAIGVIPAGAIVNQILNQQALISQFYLVMVSFAAVMMALMVGPLFLFCGQLLTAWRRGAMAYGQLARDMGRQMERRWLNRRLDADALDANDFSATTDLYAVVANAYTMNVVPVGLKNLVVAVAATTLPFLPVALTALSPEMLLRKIVGLLL
jgi:hypothetical protein